MCYNNNFNIINIAKRLGKCLVFIQIKILVQFMTFEYYDLKKRNLF